MCPYLHTGRTHDTQIHTHTEERERELKSNNPSVMIIQETSPDSTSYVVKVTTDVSDIKECFALGLTLVYAKCNAALIKLFGDSRF